jgi:hypothetical protein
VAGLRLVARERLLEALRALGRKQVREVGDPGAQLGDRELGARCAGEQRQAGA